MKHLDLFSGIGGFALAGLSVWGKDYECVGFCDIEKYAQELLKIRFPGVPIYEDIKKLTADTDNRRQKKQEQQTTGDKQCDRQVDLLTGGFPCQPFSMAGKRGGTKDDRYLWPEMLRVIKEFKPRWVIGENVFGLLSMAVNESESNVESDADNGSENNEDIRANSVVWRIKQDLLNIGYDCEVLCIPACAVNAPHRRDRLWFIAHTTDSGHGGGGSKKFGIEQRELQQDKQKGDKIWSESKRRNRNTIADTKCMRPIQCEHKERTRPREGIFKGSDCTATDTECNGLQNGYTKTGRKNGQSKYGRVFKSSGKDRITADSKSTGQQSREYRPWQEQFWGSCAGENWIEVATKLCGVDDGVSAELDGFKLSKAGHRVARIKGLGNAIVPQVAIELMKFIKEIDDKK